MPRRSVSIRVCVFGKAESQNQKNIHEGAQRNTKRKRRFSRCFAWLRGRLVALSRSVTTPARLQNLSLYFPTHTAPQFTWRLSYAPLLDGRFLWPSLRRGSGGGAVASCGFLTFLRVCAGLRDPLPTRLLPGIAGCILDISLVAS